MRVFLMLCVPERLVRFPLRHVEVVYLAVLGFLVLVELGMLPAPQLPHLGLTSQSHSEHENPVSCALNDESLTVNQEALFP